VEQADATLFVSPSGKALLVDSGKNGHGSRLKAAMQEAGVDTINYFVCTHYHEDHCGGIDDLVTTEGVPVMHAYDRGDKAFLPSSTTGGATYQNYQSAVGENATHLMRGETVPLDPELSVTCISSGGAVLGEVNPVPGIDENDMSVSLLLQYKGFRYFIGGDIEAPTEQKIADRDLVLDVDVCEADHHGSHSSSSADFMHDLKPSVVVISNGSRADYQHPRQSTLDFYAGMTPAPVVFQTNKYLKGGAGGNVDDEFIAALESTDEDGSILITVSSSGADYTVTYRDKSKTIPVKASTASGASVVIESLLPDPVGSDTELEEVTLQNKGTSEVSMAGWLLKDQSGRVWALAGLGTVPAGQSATIQRKGMPMSLNNGGDEVSLLDAGNHLQDQFSYAGSTEGVRIQTGH
jgi:beta-lactamase superfamily II metal-dependent hydrolase